MTVDERTGSVSRRTVLGRGAAVTAAVGAAGLLAACGSNAEAGAAGAGGGSSSPEKIPVSDVPVGSGKVFAQGPVVVTQPTAGDFKAFSAVCTHGGCTVSCPCHGGQYSLTDGSVVGGPPPRPLASIAVTVKDGFLTVG
jgi:Rieske Fe-S protein